MRVVLLNGSSVEVNVDPVDLWSVYKLVRDGHLEAVLVGTAPIANMRKVDPERTFGDLILESVRDTEIPPTSKSAA